MRYKIILTLIFFISTVYLFGQDKKYFSMPLDSSFTLMKEISKEKIFIKGHHEYGFSNQDNQSVDIIKDLNKIESAIPIDLFAFNQIILKESNHYEKIWTSKNTDNTIKKITEINSFFKKDTIIHFQSHWTVNGVDSLSNDSLIIADTLTINSYIILFSKTPNIITFQTGYDSDLENHKPIYCIDKNCVFMWGEVMGLTRMGVNTRFYQRLDRLFEDAKNYP